MNEAEARWIGHSTVLISLDGVRLLTDPLLRLFVKHLRRRAPVHPDALRPVDAVLLSHAHHDHLDPGSLHRIGTKTAFVVPRGIGRILARRGLRNVTELDVGDTLAIGALEIEATFAAHDGSRPPYPARAPALGFAVRGSRRVYFPGDTALFPEMEGLVPELDLAAVPAPDGLPERTTWTLPDPAGPEEARVTAGSVVVTTTVRDQCSSTDQA